jgi:hypothetical protein
MEKRIQRYILNGAFSLFAVQMFRGMERNGLAHRSVVSAFWALICLPRWSSLVKAEEKSWIQEKRLMRVMKSYTQ